MRCILAEVDLEYLADRPGVFTEEILNALRSPRADTNSDGRVSTNELRDYVIKAVPELTGGMQHPTVDRDNIVVASE